MTAARCLGSTALVRLIRSEKLDHGAGRRPVPASSEIGNEFLDIVAEPQPDAAPAGARAAA